MDNYLTCIHFVIWRNSQVLGIIVNSQWIIVTKVAV
ncbi:hypothetical protein swp_0626 [Shewanella piezotolerans WP3]|uniref:Uncharacterized protein n=1 Tax=Shewanella piezotolerans (strain WP3 / JCM 13877) TaxID=225849 RepID=B8CIH2_SHEPW|nr:hypothetical protein swp_0626 [Shewanella piezotolerans WP3]